MQTDSRVYVAGSRGMVGSAIVRLLHSRGFTNIITKTSQELDLRNRDEIDLFFHIIRPEYVFLAAAKVGGIHANDTKGADFIYDNLIIQTNVIEACRKYKVKKLVFLGSSCIYPRDCPQPIKEEYLLSGPLETTNKPYAVAKIAGIEMCDAYRKQYNCNFVTPMPTNLSGPNDHYDLENSHVFPALIRKFYEAKMNDEPNVVLWGTGNAKREFLHVDDLAKAVVLVMEKYDEYGPINIGYGSDVTITDLANMIKNAVGYEGDIVYNTSMPDGTPQKLLDSSKIQSLGWKPEISLEDNVKMTVRDFVNKYDFYTN